MLVCDCSRKPFDSGLPSHSTFRVLQSIWIGASRKFEIVLVGRKKALRVPILVRVSFAFVFCPNWWCRVQMTLDTGISPLMYARPVNGMTMNAVCLHNQLVKL